MIATFLQPENRCGRISAANLGGNNVVDPTKPWDESDMLNMMRRITHHAALDRIARIVTEENRSGLGAQGNKVATDFTGEYNFGGTYGDFGNRGCGGFVTLALFSGRGIKSPHPPSHVGIFIPAQFAAEIAAMNVRFFGTWRCRVLLFLITPIVGAGNDKKVQPGAVS